jgi:pimeloyl-ACP methyl ester carboxylesterase
MIRGECVNERIFHGVRYNGAFIIDGFGTPRETINEERLDSMELVQTWAADGLRLDGSFQSPAAEPQFAVDALCLIHGTGGNFYSSTLFDALAEGLLSLGASVLRINTRGHDGISTASTAKGGVRQGAAYEVVDDCRKDLVAWTAWLRQRGCKRVGLVGHSLGAVKCLYAAAHEPALDAVCVVALSPPRLSYSWFCSSPEGPHFLTTYREAERLMQQNRPNALLEVNLPLPFVITAAGYCEKYGPEERYNYLQFLPGVACPVLVTFGSIEVQNNMAFRGAPEALQEVRRQQPLAVETISGGDHFYGAVRQELSDRVQRWLQALRLSER